MDETDNICFVCDKTISSEKWKYKLQVTATKKRNVPVADLIKQLVGEEFEVLVGERDAVCSTCMKLLNVMDSLTAQLGEVQAVLSKLLQAKYGLTADDIEFQVQYDDSLPEDTEPLLNCDKCNFQTKYEKEFNTHVRSHKTSNKEPIYKTNTPSSNKSTSPPVTTVAKKKPKVTKTVPTVPVKFSMNTRGSSRKGKKTSLSKQESEKKVNAYQAAKKEPKTKKKKVVFQCSVCDRIFPNESLIRYHAKKAHKMSKIEVSEDEYEDVQTLEEEIEETIETPVEEPKKEVDKKKTKSKSAKSKLDFLDDWNEDENHDLSSPEKKMKIDDDVDNKSNNEQKEQDKKLDKSRRESEDDEDYSRFVEEDDEKDTCSKPTCLFCHATFSSMESVQDHIKMSHSSKDFNLSQNKSTRGDGSFEVDSTTDIVENGQQIKQNEVKHSGYNKKTFKCNFCGIKKVSYQFIQRHTKAHKRKLCLQCKLCGISFRNLSAIKIHSSKCHKAAPILKKCRYCSFKFFDSVQLKNHVRRVHNKTMKFNLETNEKEIESAKLKYKSSTLKEVMDVDAVETTAANGSLSNDVSKISVSEVSSTSLEDTDKTKRNCSLCDFRGSSEASLKEHAEKNHVKSEEVNDDDIMKYISRRSPQKMKVKCEECNYTFSRPSRLTDHMNRHKANTCQNLGICIYCSKVFLNKEQVTLHSHLVHEKFDSKPTCHVCSKEYAHVKDFRIHFLKYHFPESTENLMKHIAEQEVGQPKTFNDGDVDPNDVYSKVFKELQDLTGEGNDGEDITVDITQDPMFTYHCPLCDYDSGSKIMVKNHLKTHPQNYCNICHGIFNSEESIKHIENHSIENQNVKCFGCNDKFHDEIHLQYHAQTCHPEKKPHKCSMCVKSYLTEKSMLNHKLSKHGKKTRKVYSCSKCKTNFYAERLYHTHMEFAHRSSLNCKYCDKVMGDIKKLEFHERNHLKLVKSIYKCNVCGKVLKSQAALRTHKINHTSSKQLRCDPCNLNFKSFHTLREHSARHSDLQEKKYSCDICGKGFYFYDSHMRHRRIHLDPLLFQCKSCKGRFSTNQKLIEHTKSCKPS